MRTMKPFGWIFLSQLTVTKNKEITVEIEPKEIVICQDCKQWDEEGGMMGRGWCGYQMKCTGPYFFCADGEKEDETEEEIEGEDENLP